jgi:hypothetical protein
MGEALAIAPEISSVSIAMLNKVFVSTNEPHGQIEATIVR